MNLSKQVEYAEPGMLNIFSRRLKSLYWRLKCLTLSNNLFMFTLRDGNSFYYPFNATIDQISFVEEFEELGEIIDSCALVASNFVYSLRG